MLLPDFMIEEHVLTGALGIDPFDPLCIQPASYDVHLGKHAIRPLKHTDPIRIRDLIYVGLGGSIPIKAVGAEAEAAWLGSMLYLPPHTFILGELQEHIRIPPGLAAKIEGKSSVGRGGVTVHVTAGWVDPGWDGVLTLELCNLSKNTLILDVGQKIAQISFYMMAAPAKRPYGHESLGSHYQGDTKVQGAKA